MKVITYCSKNYKECLDIMLPTWKKYCGDVLVYSDTDEFGIKMFEPSEDFNESCTRKIKVIKKTLEDYKGQNILYIDTDVMMTGFIGDDVFKFDIMATRMVHRDDKGGVKDINGGVSFWKSSQFTINFCDEWLFLDSYFQGKTKYPEQKAFSTLCFKYYDMDFDYSVGNISERIYNLEHDNPEIFLEWIEDYRPKLIHFKTKRWKNKEIVQKTIDLYR